MDPAVEAIDHLRGGRQGPEINSTKHVIVLLMGDQNPATSVRQSARAGWLVSGWRGWAKLVGQGSLVSARRHQGRGSACTS